MRALVIALVLSGCAGVRGVALRPASPIPRQLLFGDPERLDVQLSPDGDQIAFLAPRGEALGVWVAPRAEPARARALGEHRALRTSELTWAADSRHLLLAQDASGREETHVYAIDTVTAELRDLTPGDGVQAKVLRVSRRRPSAVAIAVADREHRLPDVYAVTLADGDRHRIARNEGYTTLLVDDAYRLRVVGRPTASGGYELFRWVDDRPVALFASSAQDTIKAHLSLDADGTCLVVGDVHGRDKAALVKIDLDTGARVVLAEDADADVLEVTINPRTGVPDAAAASYLRKRWHVVDPALTADFDALAKLDGELQITSRSDDDRFWIVALDRDTAPISYHLYDRQRRAARPLFSTRPELARRSLSKMEAVTLVARDGLALVAYLTIPRVPAASPPPLVLYVHGGPWDRDEWGFYGSDQLLADRGYAVLRVNYRGSTGLGKAFTAAADHEWAGKMQDDLQDAVAWAVAHGHADPRRVAIMGGSYGGYAALLGMTLTPDAFACGVSRAGIPDLIPYFGEATPQRAAFMEIVAARVFDPRTEPGRAELRRRSPLAHVAQLKRPLLVVHGDQDSRIRKRDVEAFVDAARRGGAKLELATFPDEGHFIAHAQNQLAFYAVVERFLAGCLGGRSEPAGDDLRRSTIHLTGAGDAP